RARPGVRTERRQLPSARGGRRRTRRALRPGREARVLPAAIRARVPARLRAVRARAREPRQRPDRLHVGHVGAPAARRRAHAPSIRARGRSGHAGAALLGARDDAARPAEDRRGGPRSVGARRRPLRESPAAPVILVTHGDAAVCYGARSMSLPAGTAPRILILDPDGKTRAALLRFALKGWRGASVQSQNTTLPEVLGDAAKLKGFDVLLAACDFSADGTANNPGLRALRAIAADPANPAVILITQRGSEYTAVQAIKSGAFDYIPKELLGREQVLSAVQRALLHRQAIVSADPEVPGALRLFGYDIRRCLANHGNVSVHVAYSAEHAREVVLKVLHRGR